MIQLIQNYSSSNFGESYEFFNCVKVSKKQNKKAIYIYIYIDFTNVCSKDTIINYF